MKTLVIGLGISGRAACRLLLKLGHKVVAVDRTPVELEGVETLEESLITSVKGFDLVVTSPGINPAHPLYQDALHEGVELISEIELGFRQLKGKRVIGITGTNGKTTTTMLVTHVLQSVGIDAVAVGNVGRALSDELVEREASTYVVELSSYQLELIYTPLLDGAAVTNITPDHLDRYKSFEAYRNAKLRIKSLLKPSGTLYFNEKPGLEFNEKAAFALCRGEGVTAEQFERALSTFKKPPHRLQKVLEIEGISFYNDSKGTNVEATIAAVESLPGPIHLIAGGVDKGSDYKEWIVPFSSKVAALYLIGEAAPLITAALEKEFPLFQCGTLLQAIDRAYEEAQSPAIILLSPGCASFDQFKNYADRGEQFEKAVSMKCPKSLQCIPEDRL